MYADQVIYPVRWSPEGGEGRGGWVLQKLFCTNGKRVAKVVKAMFVIRVGGGRVKCSVSIKDVVVLCAL